MAYCIWKSYKFYADPVEIFEALKEERNCFFLDSTLNDNFSGRYSFLGCDPFFIVKGNGIKTLLEIRSLLKQHQLNFQKSFSPFLAGAVGFFSYDLGFGLEKKLKKTKADELNIPDCFFGFYSSIIIIDHLRRRLYILASGIPEKREAPAELLARDNFKRLEKLIGKIDPGRRRENLKDPDGRSIPGRGLPIERLRRFVRSNFSAGFPKEGYLQAVAKVKDYIRKGDIYQVNLSQRFKAPTGYAGTKIYRRLRKFSPSGFSAYLNCGDFEIISSSPEQFLRLNSGCVITRPMKGTRPRYGEKLLDKKSRQDLLLSSKDLAELTMIVDLERNDLGKVCDYRSIEVNPLRKVEEYSTVFQTTATIKGLLHKGKDRIDLIKACFPGGSITGCPKLRAMEIIEELEPHRRTIYTGSLGYLSFCGNMDLNILIRTVLKKDNKVYFGVGGGIVADSKAEDEYDETLVKARAIIDALA